MLTLFFLTKTIIDFYITTLLLRAWMQSACCDFYNPFSQFIIKITQPLINPLDKITQLANISSLLVAFILATIKFPLLTIIKMHSPMIDPICIFLGSLILIKTAGKLLFWVVIIRSLLSCISLGHNPIEIILSQLSEPFIHPIQRFLPGIGGINFSITILILTLYALNYLGINLFPGIWYRL